MARHVDLGHDRDEPARRVRDDLAVVVLRVVSRPAPSTPVPRPPTSVSAGQPVDLDAPALVVGEVQVQVVDLEQRDVVDVALDLVDREEVPGDVEHRAAVGEPRGVLDVDSRDGPRRRRRDQLPQGLDGPEGAGWGAGGDPDDVSARSQGVLPRRGAKRRGSSVIVRRSSASEVSSRGLAITSIEIVGDGRRSGESTRSTSAGSTKGSPFQRRQLRRLRDDRDRARRALRTSQLGQDDGRGNRAGDGHGRDRADQDPSLHSAPPVDSSGVWQEP